jgi:ribosomal protein S18 acetylase RimI-like enzyme
MSTATLRKAFKCSATVFAASWEHKRERDHRWGDNSELMSIILKPAVEGDARAIAEISVAGWRAAFQGAIPAAILDGLSVDKREAGFRKILSPSATPPARTEVAWEDGEIVGFVVFGASRDEDAPAGTGEIYAIYVRERCWGRGIGRLLLDRARASLAAGGSASLTLWTLARVERTIRFYRSSGFETDGATRIVERDGARIEHVRLTARIRGAQAL